MAYGCIPDRIVLVPDINCQSLKFFSYIRGGRGIWMIIEFFIGYEVYDSE